MLLRTSMEKETQGMLGILKNDEAKETYNVIPNWNAWDSRIRHRMFLKGEKSESQREDTHANRGMDHRKH